VGFVDVMMAQHGLIERLVGPDVEPYA